MFFLPSNEMGNLPCNESGNFWKLENMIKNVAFLKPSGSIRHIALKDVNGEAACNAAFQFYSDHVDNILGDTNIIQILLTINRINIINFMITKLTITKISLVKTTTIIYKLYL